MTNMAQQDTSSVPSRSERLQVLRKSLDAFIDEIVSARPERAVELKEEFDAAWKELNAELSPTLH